MVQPPNHAQVLVIGGGPGGSYTASCLTREGFEVIVLEASKFPRYHIGESMLPSLRPFLRFIDCELKINQHGFTVKPGAAVKFNQFKREGYTDFVALDPNNGAWNVIRSEFDDILLNHAACSGAKVFQETRVTSLDFAPPTPPQTPIIGNSDSPANQQQASLSPTLRPIAAHYTTSAGLKGTITFDYLVDASGRNGIMSTKYLRNRHMNSSLQNIACWGYWKNGGVYMPDTSRHNAPFFQALNDETGWAWYIPLHDGTASVGIVTDKASSTAKKAEGSMRARESNPSSEHTLKDHYLEQLFSQAPVLCELLSDAELVKKGDDGPVKSATDFSYSASSYAGDHFRIVGDAGAFIDPFFSSGVHLALTGALSAAASVASSIRGEASEFEAAKYHSGKVGISYTRFLLVVMGAYKQIRSQSAPVLTDVDEDNFDRAFDIIRPIIQGSADTHKHLTEGELQRTMDFCKHVLISPTDPEMYSSVRDRLDPALMDPNAPVMTPEDLEQILEPGDEDARYVLREVNARKPIHIMYSGTGNFEEEEVEGFSVRCQRGHLGLVRVEG